MNVIGDQLQQTSCEHALNNQVTFSILSPGLVSILHLSHSQLLIWTNEAIEGLKQSS
jgi:hypothetical protein